MFPLLALYVHNMDQVPIQQVLPPLGLALLASAVVWTLCAAAMRSVRKGAVAASVIVLPVLSYGHVVSLTPPSVAWLIAPLWIILAGGILAAVWKTRQPLIDTTRVLNLASLFLVGCTFWSIGAELWRASRPGSHERAKIEIAGHTVTPSRRVHGPVTPQTAKLPDIYYIILDAYGREDSLKIFYGYDNSPFIHALEQRGFYVADRSRANYDETPLCLASSLNMTYLDAVAARVGRAGSLEACREMLDDNAVAATLSRLGFRYVYIGSGIGEANVETADVELNAAPEAPAFEGAALGQLPPGPDSPLHHPRYDAHRNRLLGVFDGLSTAAKLPYKKFVYAHVLAPHPPFVFGPNGEAVYPRGPLSFADASWLLQQMTRDQYVSGYIAQLEYVNKRALQAIDAIIAQSRQRPIIIVQGDHGSRMNLDWDSLEKTDVREPFSILNAYYVPPKVREHLYATISPVNTFRIILSDVYGAHYRRLPDRSYYSTVSEPYGFVDVTALTAIRPLRPSSSAAGNGSHPASRITRQ
jgi:hypothetical protein